MKAQSVTRWIGAGTAVLALSVLVILALDVSDQFEFLHRYRRGLVGALAAGLAVTALLGWWIAGRAPLLARSIAPGAPGMAVSQPGDRLEPAPAALHRLAGDFQAMLGDCLTTCARRPQLHLLVQAFNTMLGTLEKSNLRLSDFSSDLAHELRTPIHNLLVRSQVILSRVRSAKDYREVLEANAEELERLARLIGDILFLARADQAQAALRKEPFDIREGLDKVGAYFEPLAEENGLRIECEGYAVVYADRMLVERVISNLLSNAIGHTGPGGIVRASISQSSGAVGLAVTNPGPGIPAALQGRVFDRFFQVNPSRSPGNAGSGLGLAIAKSIMLLHGGSVGVASSPEGPTTFTATFSPHPAPRDVMA